MLKIIFLFFCIKCTKKVCTSEEAYYTIRHNFNFCENIMNCKNIKEILIPKEVDACTIDIPIIVESNKIQQIYFLTGKGSLRNDSEAKECENKLESFNLDNIEIQRFNKHIEIDVKDSYAASWKEQLNALKKDNEILELQNNDKLRSKVENLKIEVPKNETDTKIINFTILQNYKHYVESNEYYNLAKDILLFLISILVLGLLFNYTKKIPSLFLKSVKKMCQSFLNKLFGKKIADQIIVPVDALIEHTIDKFIELDFKESTIIQLDSESQN